jgi:hypothetical protein
MPEGKLRGGRAHLRTRKPCSYEKRNPATQTLGGRPLSPEQEFSTGDLHKVNVRARENPVRGRLQLARLLNSG